MLYPGYIQGPFLRYSRINTQYRHSLIAVRGRRQEFPNDLPLHAVPEAEGRAAPKPAGPCGVGAEQNLE